MKIVESMRDALEVLDDVEAIVVDMINIAEHGAFIKRDLYDYTRALREALGIEESDD